MTTMSPETDFALKSKRLAPLLWVLWFLFCLRVVGQALVAAGIGSFLPPMSQWYSGLIPYPILLPIQIVLIVLLGTICGNFTRGQGWLVRPSYGLGKSLLMFSMLYGGAMILRYIISMVLMADQRWFGLAIPICFHLVLASYAFLLSRYHLARAGVESQDDRLEYWST